MSDFWLYASALAVGMVVAALAVLTTAKEADGVEISPVACYAFAGENISANGAHAMLLLNTCTGKLEWVWTPAPPRSEV